MHTYGSRKMVPICRAGIETQKTDLWTQRGKKRVNGTESNSEMSM